jgi:hypothetical protein
MKEQGQVFTLDMFFALTLTALIVSYSGLAFEQARRQAEEYALRYSLERLANDAADALVKTLGIPENWEKQVTNLEVPGLTEEKEGAPILNTMSIVKFGQFRRLTNAENWDYPPNKNAVEAIKKLFGGSEKFEVRILDENGDELWHAFPRWTGEKTSGAENALEVAVARRPVAVRYGAAIRTSSGPQIRGKGQGPLENILYFDIYDNELLSHDWYIMVVTTSGVTVKIRVNDNEAEPPDYRLPAAETERIFPTEDPGGPEHGGIENDPNIEAARQLRVGTNQAAFKITAVPEGTAWIYVIMIPSCSDWTMTRLMRQPLPATLEVRVWR